MMSAAAVGRRDGIRADGQRRRRASVAEALAHRPHGWSPLPARLRVDLRGRLSNPPKALESLTVQGVERAREAYEEPSKRAICSPTASESDVQEVPGRLSNPSPRPVQRRLSAADVNDICARYINGTTITELARFYGVNRERRHQLRRVRHRRRKGV